MATPITETKRQDFKIYAKLNVQAAYIAMLWEVEIKVSACWTSTITTGGQLQAPVKRCRFKDCLSSGTAETSISGEGNAFISDLQFLFAFRQEKSWQPFSVRKYPGESYAWSVSGSQNNVIYAGSVLFIANSSSTCLMPWQTLYV